MDKTISYILHPSVFYSCVNKKVALYFTANAMLYTFNFSWCCLKANSILSAFKQAIDEVQLHYFSKIYGRRKRLGMGWTQNNDEISGFSTTFNCLRCGAACMLYAEAQRHCQHTLFFSGVIVKCYGSASNHFYLH